MRKQKRIHIIPYITFIEKKRFNTEYTTNSYLNLNNMYYYIKLKNLFTRFFYFICIMSLSLTVAIIAID